MDLKLVKRQLLEDPEVAREYAALEDEFAALQSAIDARLRKSVARQGSWLLRELAVRELKRPRAD